MIDRCRRATGFDRIRFRFNDDGSLEVSGRNAIGGDYVQQPAASYQILADGTLIILQDATWAEMMTNSMSPTSAARMLKRVSTASGRAAKPSPPPHSASTASA